MKKVIALVLSFGFVLSLFLSLNNQSYILADGIEENEQSNGGYIVSYYEYSIYNENGNTIKNIKKGKYIITPQEFTNNTKDDEIPENENDSSSNKLSTEDNYKIQLLQKNKDNQKPKNRKPRPIMPIIETHSA